LALRFLIVVLLVGGAGLYARTLGSEPVSPDAYPRLERIPAHLPGWESRDVPLSDDVQEVLRSDSWVYRQYHRPEDGAVISVVNAYFADQSVGSQIHSPRNCLPGSGWSVGGVDPVTVPIGGSELACQLMSVERSGAKVDVLYWFRTRSGVVTGEYGLKWDLVKNSMARRPTDAVFLRFMTGRERTGAMRDLIAALAPHVDSALREAGLP